jgi:hypothetical protein
MAPAGHEKNTRATKWTWTPHLLIPISFGVTILPRAEEMARRRRSEIPKVQNCSNGEACGKSESEKSKIPQKSRKCFRRRPKSTGFNRARADDSYKEEPNPVGSRS